LWPAAEHNAAFLRRSIPLEREFPAEPAFRKALGASLSLVNQIFHIRGFVPRPFPPRCKPSGNSIFRTADDDQGKSQESKEAWLASPNTSTDHSDPWGRLDGLNS
jgi:hypothetical protein